MCHSATLPGGPNLFPRRSRKYVRASTPRTDGDNKNDNGTTDAVKRASPVVPRSSARGTSNNTQHAQHDFEHENDYARGPTVDTDMRRIIRVRLSATGSFDNEIRIDGVLQPTNVCTS